MVKKTRFTYVSTGDMILMVTFTRKCKKEKIYEKEIELLKLLKKFCQKIKLNFSFSERFQFYQRKKYYKNILGEKIFTFLIIIKIEKLKIIDIQYGRWNGLYFNYEAFERE